MQLILRHLEKSDHEKGYIDLLSQLTDVGEVTREQFEEAYEALGRVVVLEDLDTELVIGTGTLLVEQKIIHGCGKVGHIEDIVIAEDYRGNKLGRLIVNKLIGYAKEDGCYKVVLNCREELKEWYKGLGFEAEVGMKQYL